MPIDNMFWGDRYGVVTDRWGNTWAISSHKEDLSPEEMGKRAQAATEALRIHGVGSGSPGIAVARSGSPRSRSASAE